METKKFVLLDIDYFTENAKPVVRLFGKITSEDDKSIIALDKNFEPYIYVIPYDHSQCKEQLEQLDVMRVEYEKRRDLKNVLTVLKVFFQHPQDVPRLRDQIMNLSEVKDIREYDIPFYRRYLIDNDIFPMSEIIVSGETLKNPSYPNNNNICYFNMRKPPVPQKSDFPELKILSFDIEVRNPQGMPRPELDEIIIIGLYSNFGLKKVISTANSSLPYVETVNSEKELIMHFVDCINFHNPHLIVGYNSDNFDFPYINQRAKILQVPLNIGVDGSELDFIRRGFSSAAHIKGRIHVDLYLLMRRYIRLDRYTLERVYLELFGEVKKDIDGDKIYEYWDSGGEKLAELFHYALDDSKAAYKIGEKILPLNLELTRIVGQPLFDVARMATGQLVEWYLIRKAYELGWLVPNKPSTSESSNRRQKSIVGGYVKDPVKGLHENIVAFDFRSLYPSIIISKNVSPDTLVDECEEGECHVSPEIRYKFIKEPLGFVPSVIGKILKERIKIKKERDLTENLQEKKILDVQQEALKRLANSMYGVYGYTRFRWYSIECADAITAWGRDFIKKTMDKGKEFGFKPVYADTDGFYAVFEDE